MFGVTVLLSTYNGMKYVEQQIESVLGQKGVQVNLLIRDDGSHDDTVMLLREYANRDKRVSVVEGENLGPALSFLELLRLSPPSDFFAFCDQDDYWLPGKLEAAVDQLCTTIELPSLYFSNTTYTDDKLIVIGESNLNPRLTLGSALISNSATGCTIVFNGALRELALLSLPTELYMHDWWLYTYALAQGAIIHFDTRSFIFYRQHGNNVVGAGKSFGAKWMSRLNRAFIHNEHARTKMAKDMVLFHKDVLPKESVDVIKTFADCQDSLPSKLAIIRNNAFRTNSRGTNLMFALAAVLGRL